MDNGRLTRMVGGIGEAITRRQAEVAEIEQELAALEGITCVGREWWRDRDHPTKKAKMYVNHSIDQVCPLHGEPEPGGRLRVYVGSDPDAIVEAREAMAREVHRVALALRLRRVEGALGNCRWTLNRLYSDLGYNVGTDGVVVSRWWW